MRTKTWLCVSGVVVCLAIFVFGRETLSYLAGARECTGAVVKDMIPVEIEISRLKRMLTGLDGTVAKRRQALVEMQMQNESLEREIAGRCGTLASDRTALEKAKAMLEGGQESYVIGHFTYSHAEVNADARIKAERFRQDNELLAARQRTLAQSAAAINDSRKILSDAEVERQRLANSVQELEIRSGRLATMRQIDSRKKHGADSTLGKAYARVEESIADLERRLTKGERLFEIRKTGVDGINYARNDVHPSGLDALREVLQ